MKTPIILQRLVIEPNTFFTGLNFQFNNNLNIIYGNNGTGKTTLLKIIKLLTDNKERIDFEFFKHIFRNKKDKDKPIIFKYDLNPTFLNYDHPVIVCIHIKEENNIELTSELSFSPNKIEQITQKLNIQYLNFNNLDDINPSVYSANRDDLSYLSIGERSWKLFIEATRELENNLILVDDIQSGFGVAHYTQFFQYISNLAQHNQIIMTSSNIIKNYHLKGASVFLLKDPWQKNIYDYFKEDLKSDYYNEFQLSIGNIKATLKLKLKFNEKRLEDFLIRILYANIITAMETYLSDCFIRKIINNKKYIPKLLELISEFNERKLYLKKAYEWIENMNDNIIDVLSGISFHNLAKVKSMYKDILNIEFPQDLDDIFRAILIRHDIVHRNGKTKDNEENFITKQDLNNLIELISEFIKNVELQAKEI